MSQHTGVTGTALVAAVLATGLAVAAPQELPVARVNVQVTAGVGSVFDVADYVRVRLRSVGIEVADRCEPCEATLSVEYSESSGAAFLNGAVATEVICRLVLADPEGKTLWSEEIQVRSPDLVPKESTSERLRQRAIDEFKDNLFSLYLGEWTLAKLGRVTELTVLERAVSNTSPYTGAFYRGAKQAVPILRKLGSAATRALLVALTHPNWDIRADAANALGDIGDTSAIAPLERLARDDKEEFVRKAASDAVGRLRARQG